MLEAVAATRLLFLSLSLSKEHRGFQKGRWIFRPARSRILVSVGVPRIYLRFSFSFSLLYFRWKMRRTRDIYVQSRECFLLHWAPREAHDVNELRALLWRCVYHRYMYIYVCVLYNFVLRYTQWFQWEFIKIHGDRAYLFITRWDLEKLESIELARIKIKIERRGNLSAYVAMYLHRVNKKDDAEVHAKLQEKFRNMLQRITANTQCSAGWFSSICIYSAFSYSFWTRNVLPCFRR